MSKSRKSHALPLRTPEPQRTMLSGRLSLQGCISPSSSLHLLRCAAKVQAVALLRPSGIVVPVSIGYSDAAGPVRVCHACAKNNMEYLATSAPLRQTSSTGVLLPSLAGDGFAVLVCREEAFCQASVGALARSALVSRAAQAFQRYLSQSFFLANALQL